MPAIETSIQNAYTTTLTATMGPSALTASVGSTGTLVSPCYLVIDPEDDDLREVIFFDGSFTSTQFVTNQIANRYLPGSAQTSGLTHEAGALVICSPLGQHIEDLHDRDDVTDLQVGLNTTDIAQHVGGDDLADHPEATALARGFMSAADKALLNSLGPLTALLTPEGDYIDSPIRARTSGSFVDLTHLGPTVVAFNIVIPSGWNTYDVEILAVGRVAAQGSPHAGSVRVVTWQARYNGVNVGAGNSEGLINPNFDTNTKTKIQTVAATAGAQTVTGTVPIAITGTLDSTGENDEWRVIFTEARATAWWTS